MNDLNKFTSFLEVNSLYSSAKVVILNPVDFDKIFKQLLKCKRYSDAYILIRQGNTINYKGCNIDVIESYDVQKGEYKAY